MEGVVSETSRGDLVAVVWFIGAAGATRLGLMSDSGLAWSVVGGVLLLVPAVMRRYRSRMLPILIFGLSFATFGLHAATQSGGSVVGRAPDGLLPLAEALAVLACLTSPVLVRTSLRRRPALAGFGVGLATFIALVGSPATVKILFLWNFGLAGYFPAIVYAVAFGTLAFTAISCRSTDAPLALGLALLVFGGMSLHSSYQSALVILGLITLGTADPIYGAGSGRQVSGSRLRSSFRPASVGSLNPPRVPSASSVG